MCWHYLDLRWGRILAKSQGVDANFMYLKRHVREFDYYSPVIITEKQRHLKDNKKKLVSYPGHQKGYQYHWNIRRSCILIKNAELKEKRDCHQSQNHIVKKNAKATRKNEEQFDAARWNTFTNGTSKMVSKKEDLTDKGFTNEFMRCDREID